MNTISQTRCVCKCVSLCVCETEAVSTSYLHIRMCRRIFFLSFTWIHFFKPLSIFFAALFRLLCECFFSCCCHQPKSVLYVRIMYHLIEVHKAKKWKFSQHSDDAIVLREWWSFDSKNHLWLMIFWMQCNPNLCPWFFLPDARRVK